jgi:hexosaminidase
VPVPELVRPRDGAGFTVSGATTIRLAPDEPAVRRVGEYLAAMLRPVTGDRPPTGETDHGPAQARVRAPEIALELDRAGTDGWAHGDEGYHLDSAEGRLTIRAATAAGLFRGVQTLRQLLPATVESGATGEPWTVAAGLIVDRPRYPYRGVMLDVARHFFGVADVKRVIELVALYKINHLHLHLTDDQGWRIAIDSWPRLATFGGGTDVSAGRGGYYTADDYADIVSFADAHHITVVPEIDMPGHTHAALASYPELTRDGRPLDRYTGVEVGFSSLCADKEVTYRFLGDVFAELAALTPGPYLHIGGDEAMSTGPDEYALIISRVQEIVRRHGKTAIGWHEIAKVDLDGSTVVQYWGTTRDAAAMVDAARRGTRVILSPANHTYLDMKYDAASRAGLSWAGYVPVVQAYGWDPDTSVTGLDPAAVLGVEAPLWTETVPTIRDIEYLMFPRLAALAEIGWSPASARDWDGFRTRLAAQADRWVALGVDFFASPDVPWSPDASAPHEGLEVEHLR